MQYTLALNQRWCEGRATYRPPTETIITSDYEIAEIPDDTTAREFITTHHYSKTYPSARFRVGLYRHGELEGVAVFSHPCSNAVLTNVFGLETPVLTTVELGRFVLNDAVPGNGESFFISRAFDVIRKKGIVGVVSFSDPLPRKTASGEVIHLGHYGGIYQSSNGRYYGRGTARTLHLLPDGRVFSDRAAQKVRNSERGWKYAAAQLEAFGVTPAPEDPEERPIWLNTSLQSIATKVRHKGNHKYAWPLTVSMRRKLPASLPYPKFLDRAA